MYASKYHYSIFSDTCQSKAAPILDSHYEFQEYYISSLVTYAHLHIHHSEYLPVLVHKYGKTQKCQSPLHQLLFHLNILRPIHMIGHLVSIGLPRAIH